jgi:hypothetical protein
MSKLPSSSAVVFAAEKHKQLRTHSCFQSAPEMWLKVKGVIRASEYPEQSKPQNDGRGFEPFPDKAFKKYGRRKVCFEKATFNHPYTGMKEKFEAELNTGNPIVVSPHPVGQPGWHGYLIYGQENGDFLMTTKTSPPNSTTQVSRLSLHLQTNEKVDCLFMRRPKDKE